jgi:hypothetical protein
MKIIIKKNFKKIFKIIIIYRILILIIIKYKMSNSTNIIEI